MFFRAMVRIFSFGERWNVPFNSAVASLNGTFHLSPHENILTIALINIHYLYNLKHAISNKGADVWNLLQPNIKDINSCNTFKKQIKQHFLLNPT